ncbi:MAG: serine protease, partial [Spirochaetales bacterium]|nr:serine protease [Spirochaetales bacterium]
MARRIHTNVFEVVARKPADYSIEYAEPLPLDLIPFHIRTDNFVSVGTAFAIEEERFVTAAHVLALEEATLRTELYLRDASGAVYPIDRVLKYDNHRDY